jgi:hypothetical protein
MNASKQKYIQRIRSQSAYPTFRSLVRIIAILFYLLGGLIFLGALITGSAAMARQGFGGVLVILAGGVFGLFYIVIGRVTQEAASMLADIADSITDYNSRDDQPSEDSRTPPPKPQETVSLQPYEDPFEKWQREQKQKPPDATPTA